MGAASALATGRWLRRRGACGYLDVECREWGTDHQPRDDASLKPPASLLWVGRL